jgi:hypothetical protein
MRITLRAWDAGLLDAENQFERERTHRVLCAGPSALFIAVGRILLSRPLRLLQALRSINARWLFVRDAGFR